MMVDWDWQAGWAAASERSGDVFSIGGVIVRNTSQCQCFVPIVDRLESLTRLILKFWFVLV